MLIYWIRSVGNERIAQEIAVDLAGPFLLAGRLLRLTHGHMAARHRFAGGVRPAAAASAASLRGRPSGGIRAAKGSASAPGGLYGSRWAVVCPGPRRKQVQDGRSLGGIGAVARTAPTQPFLPTRYQRPGAG